MDFAQLIHDYGYFAVALGSFLEGEAVLIAGSVAAYHGHLELPAVLLIAALSSFLGDQPYFFAGRRFGSAALARYPSLQSRQHRLENLLQRHHVLLVLSLRFLYGLRIAGLLALGMSRMSTWRFLCLDFVGAIIWASVVTAAGYGLGKVLQHLFTEMAPVAQISTVVAILACSSLLVLFARRRRALPGDPDPSKLR